MYHNRTRNIFALLSCLPGSLLHSNSSEPWSWIFCLVHSFVSEVLNWIFIKKKYTYGSTFYWRIGIRSRKKKKICELSQGHKNKERICTSKLKLKIKNEIKSACWTSTSTFIWILENPILSFCSEQGRPSMSIHMSHILAIFIWNIFPVVWSYGVTLNIF